MIVFLFSILILPVKEFHSLPFEGYGILLVDLYDPQLSLPVTDGENELEIETDLELNRLSSKEITIDTSEEEMESLGEIVDLLDIISEGYKSPMIGIEMQLYKVDNGYRQNLVTMNMIVDPSNEGDKEVYSEEEDEDEGDSNERLEDFFVDVHHTYNPYDRLMNSYYGANSASFLPMNLYRSYLAAQQQQNQQPKVYDADKMTADYWNMMLNQENQEIPVDYWNMMFNQQNLEAPTYQNYLNNHPLNVFKPNYPTLEDALRMYDMEMEGLGTQELYGDDNEEEEQILVVEDENRGIFSSFGNFFRKILRALID